MFYGTECTLNDSQICLPRGSQPGLLCTGIKFIGRNAFPMRRQRGFPQCFQLIWNEAGEPLWGTTELLWDEDTCDDGVSFFDTDRGLCLLDHIIFNPADPENPYLYDACEDHPIARNEVVTLVNCHNRFGGAKKFKQNLTTGLTYDSFYFYDYDETCVGYKESNDLGLPLDEEWQDNPTTTYAIGSPQQSLELPEGPCTGNELPVMYTIAADPSNCNGVTSCIEIITRECVSDTSPDYGEDPYCVDPPPPTLFQDVLFCEFEPSIANHRRNTFCETDPSLLRIDPNSVYFCEDDISFLRLIPERIRYCDLDENIIRGIIDQVAFCNFDAAPILPPPPATPNVGFCELNEDFLRLNPVNVRFCEGIVIPNIRFCEVDDAPLRNVTDVQFCENDPVVLPSTVMFCETDRTEIDGVPEVQFCEVAPISIESNGLPIVDFCEQNIPTGVFFCSVSPSAAPGIVGGNVGFCEYRSSLIRNITLITFCNYPRKLIDNVNEVWFCNIARKLLDNVDEVAFCEHDRRTIDNVDDVAFCEVDETTI